MNGLLDLEKKCIKLFLSHSYFKISKTLRLNIHYLILFKIPKNQLSQIYSLPERQAKNGLPEISIKYFSEAS